MNCSALENFIPKNSLIFIEKWLIPYSFIIKIKRERKQKLGDYRKPKPNEPHIITVNHNLSRELCFLTLTHEIAHLIAFENNKTKRILPHGIEWKSTFSLMILESISCYPNEMQQELTRFAKNPKASFYADKRVALLFLKSENPNLTTLDDIAYNECFMLKNRPFIKVKKQKLRYLCKEISTGKMYLISPVVAIEKCIL